MPKHEQETLTIHGIKTKIGVAFRERPWLFGNIGRVTDVFYCCSCGWEIEDYVSSYPTGVRDAVIFHFENCPDAKD